MKNSVKVKNSSQKLFLVICKTCKTCKPTVGQQTANISAECSICHVSDLSVITDEVLANFMIDLLVYCLGNVSGCKKGVKKYMYLK